MEETSVGFRFYPTEEELISFYLQSMLQGRRQNMERVVPVVNVFDFEPSQLPKLAGEACKGDGEQWFFMVPRQEREAKGSRPKRTTGSGYWKATGSASYVYSIDNRVIGVKKTMVFYTGKAPIGRKTNWKMNEYKATDASPNTSTIPKMRNEFSLCRVYVTSGSSRAFDRRPMEAYPRQAKFPSSDGTVTEKTGSSETSYGNLPEKTTGQSSSSDMVDGLQQPFWEWEKLK